MTHDIVVIGIGQTLRGDDGAGLAAMQLWQQFYPDSAGRPDLRVEMAELPGIGLLTLLEGAKAAVLVDAVRSGAPPGTIYRLSEADLSGALDSSASAHGWGVAETLILGRQLTPQQMPVSIQLVGIEAGELGMGETLSPAIVAALPSAAEQIELAVGHAIVLCS